MMKYKTKKGIFLALTMAVFTAQSIEAKELRIASGVPPKHPATNPLYTDFKDQLPKYSDGRLTAKPLGTEIVSLGNMRTGVKSGLVEVGLFLPAYFPADLPEINLVGNLSLLGTNPHAMGAAMTEYVVTCDSCQAELKKLGVVYTSSHSTNLYTILSNTPIKDVGDLNGLRLRTGGPQYSRWVESMGGIPVTTPVGETFEALSQKVIDGTVTSVADIVSFRLDDVIKYVSTIELGTYHSTISHAVGLNTWASLSVADRKAVAMTSTITSAKTIDRWQLIAAKGKSIADEKGLVSIAPSQTLIDKTAAFIEDDIANVISTAKSRFEIDDAEAKVNKFRKLVKKWEAIADEVNNDSDKMAQAMLKEIWNKVDFDKYGI